MDATTDLTKLKVADLKKELKIRGLNTIGKRSELLERLQAALVAGVGLAEDDGEEEFDEDEILAGDDADDDDSKMTPSEEAAALATAAKTPATPRGRKIVTATATPRTGQRKLALRRTTSPSLVVPSEPTTPVVKVAAATPTPAVAKPTTPVAATKVAVAKKVTPKATTAVKKPATAASPLEPAKKVMKVTEDTSNKENGVSDDAPAETKTAAEKRADRFGVSSEDLKKQRRSDRFGSVSNKLSMSVSPADVETMKARASRFGETTAKALTTAEYEEKKKTRSDRFGDMSAPTPEQDEEAKSKRSARFDAKASTEDEETADAGTPIKSASGKTVITASNSVVEKTKLKRAARFGA